MIARFLFLTFLILCSFFGVGECREFVFVVSESSSMNDSDPSHKVGESIAWAIANLRKDDEVGIITFKDSPQVVRQLSAVNSVPNKIFNLEYSGRSNAGDALLTAVDMLTPKFNTERNIIFIGNGEISLADDLQTLQSVKNFQAGLEQASWANISVFIINLRYSGNPANYHSFSDFAKKEIPIPHTELMTTLRTIFHNDFNSPFKNLFESIPSEKNLSVKIPDLSSSERIKLFLISSGPGTVTLENSSEISSAISGKYINIFEISSMTANSFDFKIDYPPNTALTLDALVEVNGTLEKDISYDELELTLIDEEGERFLDDEFFEDKPVRVRMNDKIFDAKVSYYGSVIVDLSDEEEKNISLQKVYFEDLGIIFLGDDTANMILPENNFWTYVLASLAILLIVFLAFRQKKLEEQHSGEILPPPPSPLVTEKKSSPPPSLSKKIAAPIKIFPKQIQPVEKPAKTSYGGKLVIYVTKSAQEEEISPREFNLFRVNIAQINLSEILQRCNIEEEFVGAENIFVSPSKKGIFISNNSDCTIIKRNNLIEKGRKTELFYNDSVNIVAENETAELILMYKNLKPN